MKRILFLLTLCFSIIETMAQDYSVYVIGHEESKEYRLESDFSTNIQSLKVNFAVVDDDHNGVCCISFTQAEPASFIEELEEKLIAGANMTDNSISKKSYATIFFSDGTSCKVECLYAMINSGLKMILGFQELELMFQVGATFSGNVTVEEKMKRTNISGISMFGKRVNFVNFSSVKAMSAIADRKQKNYDQPTSKEAEYSAPKFGIG